MQKKIVIIGGVAGGLTCAARLRRLSEDFIIIVLEKSGFLGYTNCGLPYYLGDVIHRREVLTPQTMESVKNLYNIDARIDSEVVSVDTLTNRVVVVNNGRTYEESFDYLVISTGGTPIVPNGEWKNSSKIFSLNNIESMDKIREKIDEAIKFKKKSVIIVGGAFIGLEVAENLSKIGFEVSIIEREESILTNIFDNDLSSLITQELASSGVKLYLSKTVDNIREINNGIEATLSSGEKIEAAFAVVNIGKIPNSDFLKGSGIELSERGFVKVDDTMKTSASNVYALGDVVLSKEFVTGEYQSIQLAGVAHKQARIVANNIYGYTSVVEPTLANSIIKIFSLACAAVGLNERKIKKMGYDYHSIFLYPLDHASYYPNSTKLSIKVMFDDNGKIYGAECIGKNGVDKFIDIIATVMKLNGTIYDLIDLDFCYAPPFSSPKSPANLVGLVADNLLSGIMKVCGIEDLSRFDGSRQFLLDVRTPEEFKRGTIAEATNIPINLLRGRLDELPKDREIIIFCAVGLRGYMASRILTQAGFKNKNFIGGYTLYESLNTTI